MMCNIGYYRIVKSFEVWLKQDIYIYIYIDKLLITL